MARRTTPKRVLIIDDDHDILASVKERLCLHHFNCSTANSPELGLKRAINWRPDLILLDLCLPKMSGFGFLQEIKKHPKLRNIPVIILSSMSDKEIVLGGIEMGAKAYLSKTCGARELVSTVKNYLEERNT